MYENLSSFEIVRSIKVVLSRSLRAFNVIYKRHPGQSKRAFYLLYFTNGYMDF